MAAGTIHSIGRRKEAVCRLYLTPGSGKWDVNGRTLGDYFPRPALVSAIQQPFTATDTLGRYDVRAKVEGGGTVDVALDRRPAALRGRQFPGEHAEKKQRGSRLGRSANPRERKHCREVERA